MVKRNSTRTRRRVPHQISDASSPEKVDLVQCTLDLMEIKLRLEMVLSVVGIAVNTLYALSMGAHPCAITAAHRTARDALTEPIKQLGRVTRLLELWSSEAGASGSKAPPSIQ